MPENTNLIQSVDRAAAILDVIAKADETGLSLKEIASGVQINASTAHHLVATLIQRKLIEQDLDSKRYHLGLHLIELGNAAMRTTSLARVAQEYLDRVWQETGQTVTILVFHGLLRTPLIGERGRQLLSARSAPLEVGTLHATGSGKLLLAHLPDPELESYLNYARLERFTPATITDPDALKAELAKIRTAGYTLDSGEYGSGVFCMAAPFQDASRRVIGCIDLIFPAYEQNQTTIDPMISLLIQTAQQFSGRLLDIGYQTA
jgi:DNA-binding IclR family transcriptional regulator